EKMLYDNALLVRLFVHAWQWSRDPFFARIARETLGFIEREMTSPEGGFYSTLDADSEGEEGKYYVWRRAEVIDALGDEEGRIFSALYDITQRGNWEGTSILNVPRDPEVVAEEFGIEVERLAEIAARGKCKLYGKRAERVRPGRDEKILAGWNGWMLAAFSEAALAFDAEPYRRIVRRNADFLLDNLVSDAGRVTRSWKDGAARIGGLLEDYGGVAWGLIHAFEATQEMRYLERARAVAARIVERFGDPVDGGFFDTPVDHEPLITRPRDPFDNATPSGNSLAVASLQRLALYFADAELERAATDALAALFPLARRYPAGFGFLLGAAEWAAGQPIEIAITGDPGSDPSHALLRVAGEELVPHRILVWKPADLPLMEGRDPALAAAWVCEHYHCLEPITDPEELRKVLRERR
ncbi:MAG TPA: thioredoxin domain-containing protein, partial [Thermoanaerobaculia bacterium]|nr:thioredoxin domain-containing protein [Thermoanaerobaculia bacterium]